MVKKLLLILATAGFLSGHSQNAFEVDTSYSPEQLISQVLINNPCVSISNVSAVSGNNFGQATGIGHFTNVHPMFPMTSGIVLSTGYVSGIQDTSLASSLGHLSWPGDAQLTDYLQNLGTEPDAVYFNASSLEFDFVSDHEMMSFNFLFASEEYGTFQCTFSDAFAFFLTDTSTGLTQNIALVPNTTTPISVVTIRDSIYNPDCPSVNPEYFGEYTANGVIAMNGLTTVMTASANIIPGNMYHVKMVIADRNDAGFDSAVFIEAGSFSAGPPSCTDRIQLSAFVDSNNNGVRDTGEPPFTNGTFSLSVNGEPTSAVYSPSGSYFIYNPDGNSYDVMLNIDPEYAAYYASAITYSNFMTEPGSGTNVLEFPVTILQDFADVSVAVVPIQSPVAGFEYQDKIIIQNHGGTAASGTLTFTAPEQTSLVSTSESQATVTANGFILDFTDLAPYETRIVFATMECPPIPVVNIGDLLTATATVTITTDDIHDANNTASLTSMVSASYDPNDKAESHGPEIVVTNFTPENYLFYTIRFQNVGTAAATKVRIEDVLDSHIDQNSVSMISSSHPYVLVRNGATLVWYFEDIFLEPAIANESMSKGHVTFKARLLPGFTEGDIIPNTADIYFDSNPVIRTNTWETLFVPELSVVENTSSGFTVYPNPARDQITIASESLQTIDKIEIFDLPGKKVVSKMVSSAETTLDVSVLPTGIYLMQITSGDRKSTVKLAKD